MKDSINEIMKKEHQKIDELVEKFKNINDKTTKDSQYLFNKLGWAIKEHFFMEEKLIFGVYGLDIKINDSSELIDDHEDILNILKKMEYMKLQRVDKELLELIDILKTHSKLEEEVFYENLDNRLSENERLDLISKAKIFLKN